MKREYCGERALALHEVGHLLIAWAQEAVSVRESIWSAYGFTFTDISTHADWARPEDKVRTIAGEVAVAVAGGAAELVVGQQMRSGELATLTLRAVIAATGNIDFQHAQEWLALQRHDPSQDAIEAEVVDVFRLVAAGLADDSTTAAVALLADLLLLRHTSQPQATVALLVDEPEVAAVLARVRSPASYPLTRTTTANLTRVTTR